MNAKVLDVRKFRIEVPEPIAEMPLAFWLGFVMSVGLCLLIFVSR